MKILIQNKAKISIVGSVLAFMTAMIPSFVLADFDYPPSELKRVIIYDGKSKKVVNTRANSFVYLLDELKKPLQTYDKY